MIHLIIVHCNIIHCHDYKAISQPPLTCDGIPLSCQTLAHNQRISTSLMQTLGKNLNQKYWFGKGYLLKLKSISSGHFLSAVMHSAFPHVALPLENGVNTDPENRLPNTHVPEH